MRQKKNRPANGQLDLDKLRELTSYLCVQTRSKGFPSYVVVPWTFHKVDILLGLVELVAQSFVSFLSPFHPLLQSFIGLAVFHPVNWDVMLLKL